MTINSLTLPPAEPTVTLRQSARWAWRVLWRGKLLVGAVVALAVAPTVLVLKQTPPRYTATAQIMVEAPETNDVLDDRGATASRSRMTESVMQTEAELIASSMLARRAVEKLG
ncbi:MAG TPA: Wzz/FepE/Etk N-terminal domain-containing protein, partial [Alphaproteobacteria bacterium]|nr:Wzz/FepE/Etk N-terminal domain-containing protein [Alphaproteobacteria bacterium]